MYRLDWLDRIDVRQMARPNASRVRQVSPVVWALGVTSLFTDISAEMVNSALPVYLFLHLHLSPLQYGAIDGIYNGLSIALAGLLAGVIADRWRRHKSVAGTGYAVSAICKLLLLVAGGAWGWILAVIGADRLGKGIRTAPRDAMISLHTPEPLYGTAYGVHRLLDSTGALLGPIAGFLVLVLIPGQFDVLWIVSFLVALLGLAALWLFVPSDEARRNPIGRAAGESPRVASQVSSRPFATLVACGTFLALFSISDGFMYLLLQQKGAIAAGYLPLFYVVTAAGYMLFALPLGLLADRHGRRRIFLSGYVVLVMVYAVLLTNSTVSFSVLAACLVLLGLYYAATEGVLMALASAAIQPERRATGLAILLSSIGVGKLISSILFGFLWQQYGTRSAILIFGIGTIAATTVAFVALHRRNV